MKTREERAGLIFATKFIRESNFIENINIPFEEIWKEWAICSLKGHAAALMSATIHAHQNNLLTEQIICEWQRLIIQEQNSQATDTSKILPEREIGQYRTGGVWVGDRLCVPPQAIPACIKQLVEEVRYFQAHAPDIEAGEIQKEETILRVADFHFDFLWVHPFVDGNGRTSRILAWYLFKYFGLKPFIFTSADKHETYYKAFDGMREYFLSKSRV